MDIGTLTIKMAADVAQMRTDMDAVRSIVSNGALDMQRSLDLAKNALIGLFGVASVAGFAAMVSGNIKATASLHDLAQQSGMTEAALAQLRSVGSFTATGIDTIVGASEKLSKNLATVDEEGKGATIALKALGLNFDDFKKLGPDEQMLAVAKAMGGFKDGTDKTAAAMLLFGKEGAKLLPFLADLGAKSEQVQAKLSDQEKETRRLQAAMADAFGDNLNEIRKQSDGWKKDISMGLMPALYEASKAVLDMGNGTGGLKAKISELAKDGTLAEWARGAMTAFSYLLDVGQGLFSLLPMLAKVIAGVAAGSSELFGGIFKAMEDLRNGNISGAWDSLQAGFEGVKAVAVATGSDIADIWGQKLLGQAFRERMADLKGTQAAMDDNRASMEQLSKVAAELAARKKAEQEAAKAWLADQKKQQAEYERAVEAGQQLIDNSEADLVLLQRELDLGRKLTAAEREALALDKDIATGKRILTDLEYDQEQARIANKGAMQQQLDALVRLAAENDKAVADAQKHVDAVHEQVQAQEEHNATIGLSGAALQAHQQALLDDAAAQKLRLAGLSDEEQNFNMAQKYRAEAAELQKLKQARQEGFDKQAAVDAANAWKATFDSISEGLFQAFSKGGKSGWEYVKHLVQDTVLRMTLLPVIQQGVGAAGSLLGSLIGGPAGSAIQAGSGLMNASSGLGSLGSLGGLLAGGGTFSSGLSAGFASLLGEGGIAGGLSAGATAIGAGNIAGGLGTFAGTLGPYAAAAVAIYSLAKSLDKSGTPHMGSVVTANSLGAITGGADPTRILDHYSKDTDTALKSLLGGSVSTLNSLSTAFGGAADFSAYGKFAADNTDSSFGGLQLNRGSSLIGQITRPGGDAAAYDKDPTKGFASYAADVAKQVRAAIDTINLPDWATKKLSALTESATIDDIAKVADEVVKTAAALEDFKANIRAMGVSFASLSQISDESLMALTNAAGGLDQLKSGLKTYYGVYFSDAEKAAMQTAAISDELKKYGVDVLPHTREEFRKLVEAQDLTTQSGIDAYAALLRVASAFDAVMNSGEAAAEASKKAADEAAKKAKVDLNSQPISGGVDATGLKAMVDYEVQRQTLQANITPYIAALKNQLSTGQAVPEWIDRYLTQPIGDLEARIESVAQVQLAQDMAYAERAKIADQNSQAYLQDIAQQLGNRPSGPNREELALQAQNKATLDLIASLDKVHDALVGYKDQLTFGKLSTLGAEGQYAESRKLLDSIAGQAMAGDAAARSQFTTAADRFLNLSQGYYGSTGGFVDDKSYVLKLIDALTAKLDQLHQAAVDGNVIAQAGAAATVDALQDNNAMAAIVVSQAAMQKARSVGM